jgi:hypothetical protein
MPPIPFVRPLALFRALPVVLALALPPPVAGGDGDEGTPERLRALQAAVETAFSRCDARPLRGAFSRRLKVYMAADGLGIEGGYYGADQALLILKRMFAGRSTVRFTLDTVRPPPGATAQAVARARWGFREAGAPASEVRLAFTFMPEGSGWYLREIRELR